MKNILITLIMSFACSYICKAQLIHSNKLIKIELPAETYRMNKQQIDALTTKRHETIRLPYNYNIKGIVLNLNDVNDDAINNNLPKVKVFLDELAKPLKRHGNNTYISLIKSVKDKQALVTNQIVNGAGQYRFYLQNNTKTLTQIGTIDYPEADSAQATALLNDILNNAQFTQ